ncbi:MAG: ribosomal-protein-alanine N-acetyltransferase [Ruminococcaceae bacterium]|nr:ribosomal-protein-alanine N-acetyltransferase [Oscillospiraceae bacterium]
MDIVMTHLTEDYLHSLAELEKQCFVTPWTLAMFAGELTNPVTEYRLLVDGKTPVAYMGLWCVADEGQITNVAVHPAYRRRGLAKRLIQYFIDYARDKNLSCLTLEVRESNEAAQALYKKMGFTVVGRRNRYYEGKEDAILMTLFLHEAP